MTEIKKLIIPESSMWGEVGFSCGFKFEPTGWFDKNFRQLPEIFSIWVEAHEMAHPNCEGTMVTLDMQVEISS